MFWAIPLSRLIPLRLAVEIKLLRTSKMILFSNFAGFACNNFLVLLVVRTLRSPVGEQICEQTIFL